MVWQLKTKAPEQFIKRFPEFTPIVSQLLFSRGLNDQRAIDEFFNPDYQTDIHNPFLMLGVKEAVKRVEQAVKKKQKVSIFGDYDCDGVCGAVILKTILEALGADLSGGIYIPDRKVEGYGLNIEAVKKLGEEKTDLILTVDCGISDVEEVRLANKLGIDVVIIDHHRVGKKLPSAKVIIDPWQKGDEYPFKELAGAGVAFKLAQALAQKNKLKEGWDKWLLDLVALATVADGMKLIGENRTLVRYGLIVLAQTKRIGLQELMKIARLNPIFEVEKLKTNLDAYSLGFVLAPRLNAAGRMDHASLALKLLLTESREEAETLSQKINEHNRARQKLTDQITAEIEERIKNYPPGKVNSVIVETDDNWSSGVIGLVAGKICDRHNRPTIIFKKDKDISRGSARSIDGFNIVEAITECAPLLKEFGGHPGAAGVSLENKNFESFKEKINKIAAANLKNNDLTSRIEIDAELHAADVNWDLFDALEKLEPFGRGNEPPIFLLQGFKVANKRLVGNGSKHLKLELTATKSSTKTFGAIGFGLAMAQVDLREGDSVDAVFELMADQWNGTRNLQLKIIDMKRSA